MTRLLIVCHEPLGERMAGPAIRCLELARAVGRFHPVTLAAPARAAILPPPGVTFAAYAEGRVETLVPVARDSDVILVSGYLLRRYAALADLGRPLVVDLYDPFPIENLSLRRDRSPQSAAAESARDFRVTNRLAEVGDFFLAGSERQRDFWLGSLAANGRLNLPNAGADPAFRRLIDVVPMGIPDEPPSPGDEPPPFDDPLAGQAASGAPRPVPGDFVLVWPGGVWDWLDPLTLLDALKLVEDTAPDVKLVFPGLRHPNAEQMAVQTGADRVVDRARELGLLDARVFALDWRPYAERARYLRSAGAAVSLHHTGLESHLAIRSRLLDCVWAHLPAIVTRGDVVGEAMAARGLAVLVPPDDPEAVARVILSLRSARDARAGLAPAFESLAAEYRWSVVARPLIRFLDAPGFSADHAAARSDRAVPLSVQSDAPGRADAPSVKASEKDSLRPAAQAFAIGEPPVSTDAVARESLLELPFDLYQRHREAALAVGSLRRGPDEWLSVLDVGAGPGLLAAFLTPGDRVVAIDRADAPPGGTPTGGFVRGDATRLPFADSSFDVVVSLDTLEHLTPRDRPRLIAEARRVSRRGVVLTAPFADKTTENAENTLFEFIRATLGYEHTQLLEHLVNTLPDDRSFERELRATDCPFIVRPSGYVHRWLALMLLKHFLMSVPGTDALHRGIDRYYNLHFARADRRAPGYRSLYVLGDPDALARASAALDADAAGESDPIDEARDLGQLNLLVGLLGLRNGALAERLRNEGDARYAHSGVDPTVPATLRTRLDADPSYQIADLTAALAETRRELLATRANLTAANDLLARVSRGRVMRVLNALAALAGRE